MEAIPEPVPEIFKGKIVCKCCINKKNISFKISEKEENKPINKPINKQIDNTQSS